MKQILLIGPLPPPYYGQSVSFEMLSRNLKKQAKINIIDYSSKYVKPGSGFSFIRAFEYFRTFLFTLIFFIKNPNNSVVYITISQSISGFFRDIIFVLLSSLFKQRILLHLKGGNYLNFYNQRNRAMKKVIRYVLNKSDSIIVLGNSLTHMFDFEPLLEEKIEVIHNGLPFDYVSMPRKSDSFNILFLSNMIYSKGYDHLLEALGKLKNEGYSFNANFCGEFMASPDDLMPTEPVESEQYFLQKIEKLYLNDCVHYLGVVNGEKKNQVLSNADVFVLPTNYINEGQPVSIIEAMAFETVIVTTKYRSIVDMVEDGVEGFFVEFGDVQSIFRKLQTLINKPQILQTMKIAAKEKFINEFTQQAHLEKMNALFFLEKNI